MREAPSGESKSKSESTGPKFPPSKAKSKENRGSAAKPQAGPHAPRHRKPAQGFDMEWKVSACALDSQQEAEEPKKKGRSLERPFVLL
jgi:hypothetical protein